MSKCSVHVEDSVDCVRSQSVVGRLVRNRTLRFILVRLFWLVLAIGFAPQIVAVWRIALHGEPTDQGILFILFAVFLTVRSVWKYRSAERCVLSETVVDIGNCGSVSTKKRKQ